MTPPFELRELTIDDADAYYGVLDRNRAHLTQHGDYAAEGAATPESVRDHLESTWAPSLRFGIWLGDDLIGRVDLIAVNPPRYSIGYWIGAGHTGEGFVTEACRQLIDRARTLGATEIYAGVTHGNDKSVAVLDRLRFGRVADFETYSRFRLMVPGGPG